MLYTKVCWYTTCLFTKYHYSKCKRSALGQFRILIDGLSLPRILRGFYRIAYRSSPGRLLQNCFPRCRKLPTSSAEGQVNRLDYGFCCCYYCFFFSLLYLGKNYSLGV